MDGAAQGFVAGVTGQRESPWLVRGGKAGTAGDGGDLCATPAGRPDPCHVCENSHGRVDAISSIALLAAIETMYPARPLADGLGPAAAPAGSRGKSDPICGIPPGIPLSPARLPLP